MFTKLLSTLSTLVTSRMKPVTIFLLVALLLTGLMVACTTNKQAPNSASAQGDIVAPVAGSGLENSPGQAISQLVDASASSTKPCVSEPLFSYTIAGQKIPRRSELGILGNPDDYPPICAKGQNTTKVNDASDADLHLCTDPPLFVWTIAGQTISRRSELGILGNPDCSILLTSTP